MHTRLLNQMTRGWFVGNFDPSVCKTEDVEVGIKEYQAGDSEEWHYHKIATEITVILSGAVEMGGRQFRSGDIIVVEPGEGTDFRALENTRTVVVKLPGAPNDKYLQE